MFKVNLKALVLGLHNKIAGEKLMHIHILGYGGKHCLLYVIIILMAVAYRIS